VLRNFPAYNARRAPVVKLADTPDLGSGAERRGGSSPSWRTKQARKTHLAAIVDPKAVGGLLRAIDAYDGMLVTKSALKLAPLVFVRPGELRQAEWSEVDFDNAEWNIPGDRMKMRDPHLVPLSRQAVSILRELHPYTGDGLYVFPSARTRKRPMSDNAILSALRRMGFAKDEMSGHGFRAMARTILDEILHVRLITLSISWHMQSEIRMEEPITEPLILRKEKR
jgi:integrase